MVNYFLDIVRKKNRIKLRFKGTEKGTQYCMSKKSWPNLTFLVMHYIEWVKIMLPQVP